MMSRSTMSKMSPPDSVRRLLPKGVCYYGPLEFRTHDEFVDLVGRQGGRYVSYAHRADFALLVVGDGGLPVTPAGDPIDFKGRTVVAEHDFLRLLGETIDDESVDRTFSAAPLAELLEVPEARLKAWVKAGLLRPRHIDRGTMRFDFRQAAVARTLVNLTSSGVSVGRIRRTLDSLQKWLPDLSEPLQQLAILERNGPLLLRLETGDLVAVDGQMQLDFEGEDIPPPLRMIQPQTPRTAVDWHQQGVSQERDGMLAEAENSYREALTVGGPEPQIVFDLAHVLSSMGKPEQATERYRQVVELDPTRSDAWNNLGILLSDTGHTEAAVEAFRTALRLDANDAMAHYNLADTLDTIGRSVEAKKHFRLYLECEPNSEPWSEYARSRIGR